jgi:hypothetical protein
MSLVKEQSEFLLHVCKLIEKANALGFVVTGGELYRPPEMQEIYVRTGRSQTMKSNHLRRCAVDLNFFKPRPDQSLELTYDIPTLKPLGEYWESLAPGKNSWGGNWSSFKDVPHFERRA